MSVNNLLTFKLCSLLAFLLLSIGACADSTRHGWTLTYIKVLEEAILKFQADVGRFPTTTEGLSALIERPRDVENWNGPYVERSKVPLDRWEHELRYLYPSKYGDKAFDLYSFGPNGIDDLGRVDDISNWSH